MGDKQDRQAVLLHDLFITHDPELIEMYADYELHLENQTGTLISKEAK